MWNRKWKVSNSSFHGLIMSHSHTGRIPGFRQSSKFMTRLNRIQAVRWTFQQHKALPSCLDDQSPGHFFEWQLGWGVRGKRTYHWTTTYYKQLPMLFFGSLHISRMKEFYFKHPQIKWWLECCLRCLSSMEFAGLHVSLVSSDWKCRKPVFILW